MVTLLLLIGLASSMISTPGLALLWKSENSGMVASGEVPRGELPQVPAESEQTGDDIMFVKAPGAYPNSNYVNYAKEIDMSSGVRHTHANDGVQHGFYGQETVAETEVEDSPWLRVDLGQVRQVVAVELWAPKNPCASLKLAEGLKRCPTGMVVSVLQPMVVSLEAMDGRLVSQHTITDEMSVYGVERVYQSARYVRFALPGAGRQLMTTEVKVWVEDREGMLCTERSCRGGTCVCVGQGCPAQVCQCDPTRIGTEDCTTDPAKDWRYLPLQTAGASPQWNSPLWAQLMVELQELQAPSGRCNAEVFNGLIGAGLASTLHFMTGQLSEAYFKKRPFVFGGMFNYAGTAYCKKMRMLGDFDCYFKAFSGGACLPVKEKARRGFKGVKINPRQPNRCAIGRLCSEVGHFKRLPDGEYGEQGNFWWRTAMAAHLLRINDATQRLLNLEELKRQIGFQHPIIGVHVRHGDACHTTLRKGHCKGLGAYLPEIRSMSRRYNTTRVFLATDDAKVVREAASYAEFQFVYIDFNRNVLNSKDQIEYRKNLWDGSNDEGHRIMVSSLIDLLLLSESDYLITHFLSNMSRLALELSAAFHQRVPPFSSMDGPWCHHWKMCMGR